MELNGKYRNQSKNAGRKVAEDQLLIAKSLLKEVKSNTKAFSTYARSKLNFKNTMLFLVDSSKTMSDENGKEKLLIRFFKSVFTEKSHCLPSIDHVCFHTDII